MDIGLVPLQDSMFNNGKSPTKMFEYMAMKCAVIASDVGEAAHIIENGANGLKAQEIKDFGDCVKLLVDDRAGLGFMIEEAYKMIYSSYSQHVLGDRLYQLVQSLRSKLEDSTRKG